MSEGPIGPAPRLTEEEIVRYARHILLPEVGGGGQAALKAARVLVVGAGGLGCPALLYLAAAGVGTLGIVDDDVVSLSNLQRQILYRSAELGRPKTECAARALGALNLHVAVSAHPFRLTADNAPALVGAYDLVLDGSDNFATRLALADACRAGRRTLVSGAVRRFEGQLAVFKPHGRDEAGESLPCYRCLVPEAPPQEESCEEVGVLGPVTGIIGTLMASEALKEIAGFGTSLAGRLLLVDAMATTFRTVRLRRDPSCPACGAEARLTGAGA